ncbi:MAG: two-component system cell cycle sensor histidine kinase/response regulator CckA [Kiritimatiellia bacterium]|jgi:two-component system cell cycle sensor histidine kinase/response regulator CckA
MPQVNLIDTLSVDLRLPAPCPVLIWTTDVAGICTSFSGEGVPWLATPHAAVRLEARLLIPADSPAQQQLLTSIADALTGIHSVFHIQWKQSTYSMHLQPLQDSLGIVIGISGVILSQTVSMPDAEWVDLSEERYRLLVEASPYCIHQIDLDGRLTSMNRAGLDMMDVQLECEIQGLVYLDLVSIKDRPRIAPLMASAYEGVPSRFEFESVNGHFFSSSFIPLVAPSGNQFGLMGLSQDITERKNADRALIESEQGLELALAGARLGLWDYDLKNKTYVLDDRMDQIFGEDAGLSTGTAFLLDFVYEEDRQSVQTLLDDHFSGRTSNYESEHRILTSEGLLKWVHDRGRVVERDDAGQPLRFSGISMDITEQKRDEVQRRELESQLQQVQRMETVGQLAGGIAHDFNNLLQVILGHVDFALMDAGSDEGCRSDLNAIKHASERAADLTRQLLAVSKRQTSQQRVLDVNELIVPMISMLSRVMPETITLEFVPMPGLAVIEVDPGHIEQILLNLCVNARDAMPQDGKLLIFTDAESVNPEADPSEHLVSITVSDSGEGMAPEILERAIEPFFSTKSPHKGTGLGLSMVYGLTTQNGGNLHIESQLGVGTLVRISFPASYKTVSEITVVTETKPAPGKETILVIEDEDLVREMTQRILSEAGHTVLMARNGVEGLEVFDAHADQIDLVLIDVVMPEMMGRETCEHLLERAPQLNVLFMSGYPQGASIDEDFLSQNQLEVLQKPFTVDTLLHKIQATLVARPAAAQTESVPAAVQNQSPPVRHQT